MTAQLCFERFINFQLNHQVWAVCIPSASQGLPPIAAPPHCRNGVSVPEAGGRGMRPWRYGRDEEAGFGAGEARAGRAGEEEVMMRSDGKM